MKLCLAEIIRFDKIDVTDFEILLIDVDTNIISSNLSSSLNMDYPFLASEGGGGFE